MAESSPTEARHRRTSDVGFVLLAIAVACGFVALLVRQLGYGLEFDESYLLGVARNLAEGRGYVDDGVTFFSTGQPFAPTISTGPTVVLPVALAWALTDGSLVVIRGVMIVFTILLAAVTWWIFVRLGGRWAALAATAGLLMIPVVSPDLQNGSLMPGRVVGELPALALLVLPTALIVGRHYLWAGLALGLCLEAKLAFLLPAAIMLLVWVAWGWRTSRREQGRLLGLVLAGTLLPLLAFEAYTVASLGLGGYGQHLAALRAFTDEQDIDWSTMVEITGTKFASIADVVPRAAIVVALLLAVIQWRLLRVPKPPRVRRPFTREGIAVLSLTLASTFMLLWWLLRMWQTSPRPGVPAIVWLAAAGSGVAMLQARRLVDVKPGVWTRALAVAVYVVLLGNTTVQALTWAGDDSGNVLLAEQRKAALIIRSDLGAVPRDAYWTNPELLVLTRLPPDPAPPEEQTVAVYSSVRAFLEIDEPDARAFLDRCPVASYTSRAVIICRR